MALDRQFMMDRIMESDAAYDRVFVTGVLSTGIYCLPSCRARKPKPENVQFFSDIQSARNAGLRACKKCRPDEFYAGIDLELEQLEACVARLRLNSSEFKSVDQLADQLGMSSSKLYVLFKKHFHSTPGDYCTRLRVESSCVQLLNSEVAVSDIALDVGFESLSTFYEHFGKQTGMTPSAYRKLNQGAEFLIDLPPFFQFEVLRGYIGRDPESLTERVNGSEIQFTAVYDGAPHTIRLKFETHHADCFVDGPNKVQAHRSITRILGLNQDPSGFELLVRKLGIEEMVGNRIGLRMPMTPGLYDGIVWAILGQQVNLKFAYSLRRRLVELVGQPLENGFYAPPQPHEVANLTVEDLLPLQFSRRKAEYLIDCSRLITSGDLDLELLTRRSATGAEKRLMAIRGFGPWSTHYVMMRAMGFSDCLPVGDTGLTSALQKMFALETRPNVEETRGLMEKFSPYRSLATFHLWQSLKFES